MDDAEKIDYLKKNIVFTDLTIQEYIQIAEKTKYLEFPSGHIIFHEDMKADAFYLILEGEVEILKKSIDGDVFERLATRYANDSFGELSMIDNLPRSASIKAATDLRVLKINDSDFVGLMNCIPRLSFSIAKSVTNTIRLTNDNYIKDLELRNKQLLQAYDKIKHTQEELIRSERLSMIGKFASLIIHDIKNPMTNIRAYAELLSLRYVDDPKQTKAARVIIDEVDRLTEMTGELLEFARGDMQLNLTTVDMTAFVVNLIDLLSVDMKSKGIIFDFSPSKEIFLVSLDIEKMKRVFFNLVNNSAEAMISGGTIFIELAASNEALKFVVRDMGTGMSDEVVKHVFEPFFTKKAKGTGLGMAIVKGIIDSHGGTIDIISKIGEGTEFTIHLPMNK